MGKKYVVRSGSGDPSQYAGEINLIDPNGTAWDAGRGLHLPPWYLSQNNNFRQIPVVMLHQFADQNSALGVIKDYLAWGYETIFYSEMMEYLRTGDASNLPDKPVVLTDDDGGLSAYTALFPALQSLGMKCTYFVVPKWVNGDIAAPPNGGAFLEASAFTWENAREMQASGLVEFQSHTLTHGSMRALTGAGTFTADLSADGSGAGADFLAAKAMIEANVPGANVQYNAAPYGVINEAGIASLKAAGCKGNRITFCGKGLDDSYDGSGQPSFTYPSTDHYRVPNADGGNFKHIKRFNKYGTADADGNMFENGKFLATQRGITLAAGWTFATAQPLPNFASPSTGPVLQGAGTAAATAVYHTEKIPVGYWGFVEVDWWVKCTSAPAASARLVLETFVNPFDTVPVSTLIDPQPIGNTTGWTRRRWGVQADNTFAWVRPRFEVVGATAATNAQWWDVKVRRARSAWQNGS